MKQNINICYSIDLKFIDLTLESIEYIKRFFTNKYYNLQFYIICDQCPAIENINIVYNTDLDTVPIPHRRAYIPDIIQCDKIIYLDSDTITLTCISKLWCIDLEENIIAAAPHYHFKNLSAANEFYNLQLDITDKDLLYLNSGVMLIDCEKWRYNNITEKCRLAMGTYDNTSQLNNDEPGINIALKNKWHILSENWNYLPRGDYKRPFILHYYGQYFNQKPCHNMF